MKYSKPPKLSYLIRLLPIFALIIGTAAAQTDPYAVRDKDVVYSPSRPELTNTDQYKPTPEEGKTNLPPCKGPDRSNWNNCFGDRTYLNRDYYVGQWRDGKRHGQGTYYFYADNQFKGDKYVGEFKVGKFNGLGTLTTGKGDESPRVSRRPVGLSHSVVAV